MRSTLTLTLSALFFAMAAASPVAAQSLTVDMRATEAAGPGAPLGTVTITST